MKSSVRNWLFPTPRHLQRNHLSLSSDGESQIRESLKHHYHIGWRSVDQYTPSAYAADVDNHVKHRIQIDRDAILPWLEDAAAASGITASNAGNKSQLDGWRILEIGCGTGSSSIALAEQGAKVIGLDIDEGGLQVARDRNSAYGTTCEFVTANATEMEQRFANDTQTFQCVLFFASLEHMTISERIASLRQAWNLLPVGGQLGIVETPNRLWYYDDHTAWLPFYHWLPNELAFRYAPFSPRENFRDSYDEYDSQSKEHFLRRGRGFSFHELEVAIGPVDALHVVSSLSSYRRRTLAGRIRFYRSLTPQQRAFRRALKMIDPRLHEGWLDESLHLVIQKRD
ncbi:MAG: methyltransferase domain-containing protein [Planctomycetota bacterium]